MENRKAPSKGDILHAKIDAKISGFLERLFAIARWDKKLYLPWLRYLLLPFIVVPQATILLGWLAARRNETIDDFLTQIPFAHEIMINLMYAYIWLRETGIYALIITILPLSFLQTCYSLFMLEKRIRNKVTFFRVITTYWYLALLYIGSGNLFIWMAWIRIPIKIIIVLLFIFEPLRLLMLRRRQQMIGPLDPQRVLKWHERKVRKSQSKTNKRHNQLKKHGRN